MPTVEAESAWSQALSEIAQAHDTLERILRIAGYVHHRAVARELALPAGATRILDVAVLAKPGLDPTATSLDWAKYFAAEPLIVNFRVHELATFHDVFGDVATQARAAAAVIFVLPALAPAIDETLDSIQRELPDSRNKVLIALAAADTTDDHTRGIVSEVREELPDTPVATTAETPSALAGLLASTQAPAILNDLRTHARSAAAQLLPLVRTSAEFLSCSQPQFLRRLEFIRRDLAALKELEERAGHLLGQISEAALQRVSTAIDNLSGAMQKIAESTVENAQPPREALATQESRHAFGRQLSAAARAAAFREYTQRTESFAMDLNSARSLLLSNLGQIRVEAAGHFEELTLNLGMDLYSGWLGPKPPAWGANPLDISLDPGAGIASALQAYAQSIRQNLTGPEFVSGWAAGRIERMFKSEIASNAVVGWNPNTIDQPLAAAIRQVWHRDTERPCGLLIGRLRAIIEAVTAGLKNYRLEAHRLPRLAENRAKTAELYRNFALELETVLHQNQVGPT
jgi:hypothetical protein